MQKRYIIFEYQQVLTNRSKNMAQLYFSPEGEGAAERNSETALVVLRYAVENLLKWTPEQMKDRFGAQVISDLKLGRIMNRILIPPEILPTDYFYYAHILYPDRIPVDYPDLTLHQYKRVLNKEIQRIPRGFFDDGTGIRRAKICLNYVITNLIFFDSVQDAYKCFSSPAGDRYLKTYRLETARDSGWNSALDYFHDSVSPEDRNEVYYHYYKLLKKMKASSKN